MNQRNEFYCVLLDDGDIFYFRNRDRAFEYLWVYFLKRSADCRDIASVFTEMNETAEIEGYGRVMTRGFED